jgi:hypothetical protein
LGILQLLVDSKLTADLNFENPRCDLIRDEDLSLDVVELNSQLRL